MELKKVSLPTPLPLFYVGKDLSDGPLPIIIYFALSAKESLTIHPYNKPVTSLLKMPARVFSVDLPFHGEDLPSVDAMKKWAKAIEDGEDLISDFLSNLKETLSLLFDLTKASHVATCGLSRGGFIASHIAAAFPQVKTLVTFAPLIKIEKIKEFHSIQNSSLLTKTSLDCLTKKLSTKNIKAFIGGHDTRVGTDFCFYWIQSLINAAYQKNIRSAPIELSIKPSIGYAGHGTSQESFQEGANWIMEKLKND
jgi:pimeloyl-ACP methyl ester carboxylesterase